MSLFRRQPAAPVDERRSMVLPEVWQKFVHTDYSTTNPTHGLTAMQSVAIWATADLIASTVSELPVDVYSGRSKRSVPGNIEDPGGDDTGREDWAYRLIMSWLIRGNAYGFGGDWNPRTGTPRTIGLLGPSDVTASTLDGDVQWYHKGKRLEGRQLTEFMHLRVNPQPGMLLGQSVIEAHATSIGISLRSARFGDQWFKDGAHPSGMLVNEHPLNDAQASTAKTKLIDALRGTRDPLVLGQGWKYDKIQISPEESQFIETQKYSEAQCARMFGPGYAEVLGYESGGSMTYSNIVDRRQDLLVLSLNRWIRRYDRVLTSLLPPSTQRVRADRDALLEATTKDRYESHKLALDAKWKTINEVRETEDLLPVAWGAEPEGGSSRQLSAAEVSQKVYLAVANGVLSVEEGRDLIAAAGADIDPKNTPKGATSGNAAQS